MTESENTETLESIEEIVATDPLAQVVGDHPRTRILIALLDVYPRGLNPTSIKENAALGSRSTVYNHLDSLLATGLVVEDEQASEQAGNSTIYKLVDHEDDERTEWLGRLRDFTAKHLREKTDETDNE
ncbi:MULTISPECIES: winged helix-turn-helix domain-containing protein [Halorussus]|uniref:winged helix-turn-helix domain-containing protein n=1 Tax=Halorussus TaxID=1070314 RepID=UPI00209DC9AE|nr:winged helix-turn-helix domain-containing protein [Halorussus vallis]USZ78691.1 winged helix-turn-helix domain-containing protein [Halorussus vallis]